MRKLLASLAIVTAVSVGGLAMAVINPVQGAFASSPVQMIPVGRPAKALKDALAGLVTDKTITQAQADAVAHAVNLQNWKLAAPKPGDRLLGQLFNAAAQAIGVTPKDLIAGLKAGQSMAAQATAKKIDPKVVEDALIAATNKWIDDSVANKTMTPQKAAALKANVPALAEKALNAP